MAPNNVLGGSSKASCSEVKKWWIKVKVKFFYFLRILCSSASLTLQETSSKQRNRSYCVWSPFTPSPYFYPSLSLPLFLSPSFPSFLSLSLFLSLTLSHSPPFLSPSLYISLTLSISLPLSSSLSLSHPLSPSLSRRKWVCSCSITIKFLFLIQSNISFYQSISQQF